MEGIIGIIGSGLFLFSWILQAWESRKAGQAIVTFRFFLIRLLASLFLVVEAWRVESYGFLLLVGGTIVLILYNLYVIKFGSLASERSPA